MTHNDSQFDFSLASDVDAFDPLAVANEDDDDEDYDEEPGALRVQDIEAEVEKPRVIVPADKRTPFERTSDLIKQMPSQRKVLLGILAFCTEKQPADAVNARIADLQENNRSVFTANSLCSHLEKAGALELIGETGEPYEETEVEPKLVEIDGVEYYETQEAPTAYWHTTETGQEVLAADRPLERLEELFAKNKEYLSLYQRVLLACCEEGGASTASLSACIDNDPLVQKPRRYAPYFIDGLEKCDAVEWKKSWCITEVGREALSRLAESENDTKEVPTSDAQAK